MAIMTISHKLHKFLQQYVPKPFDWGTNNCSHFIAEWVRYTGRECDMSLIPAFDSQAATRRFFVEQNDNLADLISVSLGASPQAKSFAAIGDVVLVRIESIDFVGIGIYQGPEVLILGDDGVPKFVNAPVEAVWRI
jgi:hypothetical protein